jgi:hypothetical protein
MNATVRRTLHRAKPPMLDAEREAERARLPWRTRHIARKYNVGLPLASVVAGLVFDVEARQ